MTADMTYLIVGASLAGAKAAEALRAAGFDGRVVLIGAEDDLPYERPPLSKDYLQGKTGREKIYVHPARWYADSDVDLRLGAVASGIDRAG
jgi:3-phenylpropionate/trans-cinnamate dioxygenase ferredoxin reductase component